MSLLLLGFSIFFHEIEIFKIGVNGCQIEISPHVKKHNFDLGLKNQSMATFGETIGIARTRAPTKTMAPGSWLSDDA